MPEQPRQKYLETQHRHVTQCLREAWFVGIVWFASLLFVAGWIGVYGYLPESSRPDEPTLVLGIPSWAFWGLFVPWLVLVPVTWFFAAVVLKDDEPILPWPDGDDEPADQEADPS